MNQTISPKIVALVFSVLAVSFLTAFYVIAWQEPTQSPPNDNVPAPLNAGPVGQSKAGGLILNTGGAENGLIIDKGKICLGTSCISSWIQTTYQMNAASYDVGANSYSKTVEYTCPVGTVAIQTYYKPSLPSPTCLPGLDACLYSVSADGRTAQLKAWAVQRWEDESVTGCSGIYYNLVDSCIYDYWAHPYGQDCGIATCTVEFQCGIKQVVGQ